jgi:sulfofructose kinase
MVGRPEHRAGRRRTVFGLGLAVVDHLYVVDALDLRATRIRYTARIESGGGMVSTALSQAAALGCRAEILSFIGRDREGRVVRRLLSEAGVGVRRLLSSGDQPTTVAAVLVERKSGERRFLVADRRSIERAAPDFDLSGIREGSILLVDGHFAKQALRAVKRAREVGAVVVADFSHPRREFLRLLPYVDYPIVPLDFAKEYAGRDPRRTLRRLYEEYGATPIVTLGRKGGIYLEEGREGRYRAARSKVVDTTGAGDVFHGAFAAGLCRGFDLAASIDLARRAAALNCGALGGRGRLLQEHEIPRTVGLAPRRRTSAPR